MYREPDSSFLPQRRFFTLIPLKFRRASDGSRFFHRADSFPRYPGTQILGNFDLESHHALHHFQQRLVSILPRKNSKPTFGHFWLVTYVPVLPDATLVANMTASGDLHHAEELIETTRVFMAILGNPPPPPPSDAPRGASPQGAQHDRAGGDALALGRRREGYLIYCTYMFTAPPSSPPSSTSGYSTSSSSASGSGPSSSN